MNDAPRRNLIEGIMAMQRSRIKAQTDRLVDLEAQNQVMSSILIRLAMNEDGMRFAIPTADFDEIPAGANLKIGLNATKDATLIAAVLPMPEEEPKTGEG